MCYGEPEIFRNQQQAIFSAGIAGAGGVEILF
jgi:hypothetical protein